MNLPRTLEPKPLDPSDEAAAYQSMSHEGVNRQFVEDLCGGGPVGPEVIDLGCGPAEIPILLCQRLPEVRVMAIDMEIAMLEIAKREIDIAGLLYRISLHHGDVCALDDYQDELADTLISNSLLHHLEQPVLGIETAVRLLRPGGRLFMRDLVRPESNERIEQWVTQYAGEETPYAQQLLRQSFSAALTLQEVRNLAGGLGIDTESVQMTSDRHWTLDWSRQS